jgi:AcrR family transcriptional regulator
MSIHDSLFVLNPVKEGMKPDPIQQQLITAREEQILDAAAAVFAEKGFHQATIRDIAQRAGIADGTIYNYFDNKPALLLGIFERMREAILAERIPTVPGNMTLSSFFQAFLAQPLTTLEEDGFALFRIVLSEMMVDAELRTLYRDKILAPTLEIADRYFQEQADKQGIHLSPENVCLLIRVLASTVMGLMLAHIMGEEVVQARWEELPAFVTELVLTSLEASAG